ncbi:RsmD family RNA methyltransferase [Flavobacterium sp.]|uniref:RsmD family RNA methyltransferase n=1 Tax=Flavobacterium sp. TaxID=239 RepID=UPI003B9959A7
MRIVSGTFKGRRIQAPKNLPVRPTTDMSKEALFNVLNNRYHFSQLRVLDLFSGTGNISYEFASRGSQEITAVDADFNCVKFIKATSAGFEMDLSVVKSDVYKFLEANKTVYDLIFADPPYDFSEKQFLTIVDLVFEKQSLESEGCLIIEHSKHTKLDVHPNFVEKRAYGGSVFSFFENLEAE